jgi:purple acid phosphatase-like protein/calcineurin-like phosphoesterase family protein
MTATCIVSWFHQTFSSSVMPCAGGINDKETIQLTNWIAGTLSFEIGVGDIYHVFVSKQVNKRGFVMRRGSLQLLVFTFSLGLAWSLSVPASAQPSLKKTMDGIISRFYTTLDPESLQSLNQEKVLKLITDEERAVLATKYWTFKVNVPAVVSLIRNVNQPEVAYWIEEAGFKKTDGIVKNRLRTHEVWQKEFDPGQVELGINGFDRHLAAYFVCVGSQEPGAGLEITEIYPEETSIIEMKKGAWYLRDWQSLRIEELPESLVGQQLLTTFRGRAWEAHLVGGFRTTPFPSSGAPDHVILTWSEDPRTTQTIQWRTDGGVGKGIVRYREADSAEADYAEVVAETALIDDRLLMNDRYTHRHTAVLRGLKPATAHLYSVGSPDNDSWSNEASFSTAPDRDAAFSFVYLGDIHCWQDEGRLIRTVEARHPEAAFYTIAGDLTRTGLFRNDWDEVFEYARGVFDRKPVAWALGNHDQPNGLGSWLPLALAEFPRNGPAGVEPERNFSFCYGNALFLVLDVETSPEIQAEWMEQELAKTDATWRFAMFHFPAFAPSADPEYEAIRCRWEKVFAKYHLDLMLHGHVHYYLRTKPMRNGQAVESPADGTIHLISLALPGRERSRSAREMPEYVEKSFSGGPWYQTFNIDGNRLAYRAYDAEGKVCDEFVIEK